MKVINEFSNKLLNRREINAVMEAETNPGFEKTKKELAAQFGVSEDVMVVKSIKGRFGSHYFSIDAFIYNSIEDKEKIEPKKKIKEAPKAAS